ncbi:MAG TPA: SRPBCC family protein [Mucilaginibacter sp.]|nr:SRPBCC family protein [Mucilaginibacter sp.]
MNKTEIKPIRKEVVVNTSQATAFKTFTQKMDLWWPRTHHIGSTPLTELVLEPGNDGRWFSRHEDGSEVDIGRVLTWDPDGLLVLAWQINGDFKFDPELITEVEVRFIPEEAKRTRVMFEHRNLDRLGGTKPVESMDEGWGYIMGLYKDLADSGI